MPSPSSRLPFPVLVAVLGQTLISAGTHLAARQATQEMPPFLLVTLRLSLAALVFVVVLAVTPGPRFPPRRAWRTVLFFGFLAGPLNQGLFMYGLSRSKATHGGLLYALTPVGVYLMALLLRREKPSRGRLTGISIAFTGVLVLLLGRGLTQALGPLVGDLFILGAVLAWVVFTTESRTFSREHGGLRTAGWSLIVGGLLWLPLAPFFVTRDALANISVLGWECLGYLVVLTSVVSYALWNFALARVEASRVAIFTNLQPVATAVAAFFVLNEPLTWEVFVGGALVLVGVRLAQR
jgi:drug/metabolite transporter (DMT)-like permease